MSSRMRCDQTSPPKRARGSINATVPGGLAVHSVVFRLPHMPDVLHVKHMSEVGIRALKQNASAVVAEAAAGDAVTITDRGRPVAVMTAIPQSRLQALIEAGERY